MTDTVLHQVHFDLDEGHDLVGLVILTLGPDGQLHAASAPPQGRELPPEAPRALRFLADAIDIDRL